MHRSFALLALVVSTLVSVMVRGEEPPPQGAFWQWKAKLASSDPAERQRAIVVLTELLPDQSAAVPYLVAALDDPIVAVREIAQEALSALGEDALPGLIACLEPGDSEIRVRAMEIIQKYGPAAEGAVGTLTGLLDDEHPAVRKASAATLAAIGEASAPAAERLNALLHDDDEEVRGAALLALARIDGFLPGAIGDLEELAARDRPPPASSDGDRRLADERAIAAAAALVLLRPDVESFRLLDRKIALLPVAMRRAMVVALVRARMLQEWESGVTSLPAAIAVRAWNAALDADDPQLRRVALFAASYNADSSDDHPMMPVLELASPDALTRRESLLRLASVGDAARDAAPRVIPFLADESVTVRWAAARALGSIDDGSDDVLRALAEATAADNVTVRCEAVKALARIGVRNDVVDAAIEAALEDENPSVRATAEWAQRQMR